MCKTYVHVEQYSGGRTYTIELDIYAYTGITAVHLLVHARLQNLILYVVIAIIVFRCTKMHVSHVGCKQLQHDFVIITLRVARDEFLEPGTPLIIRRGL